MLRKPILGLLLLWCALSFLREMNDALAGWDRRAVGARAAHARHAPPRPSPALARALLPPGDERRAGGVGPPRGLGAGAAGLALRQSPARAAGAPPPRRGGAGAAGGRGRVRA